MTQQRLIAIVEGEGDERAVPVLLRRILESHGRHDVRVLKPHRRGELPKVKSNFERFFQAAALEDASILCILDFDCEFCNDVEHEEEYLRKFALKIRPDVRFDACLIVKEFESMFLWDESSARAVLPQIPPGCVFPENPETIRDAKGWLSKAQPKGHSYKPTAHQAKLAAQVDLATLLTKSPSFRRLNDTILRIIG